MFIYTWVYLHEPYIHMNMYDSYYKHEFVCSYHCFTYIVAHFTQCFTYNVAHFTQYSVIYSKLSTSVHKQRLQRD